MVDPKAGKFINSLVKSLQMLCHGYMDFKDNIEIIGHIYLRIDNSQKFDYIVNEQVSKQGDDSTFFQSNSYHSVPPSKTGRERERSASGRSDDDTIIANHHRLDDSAIGGSRVQIDLSGPVPVTRNSESSPDCFFNAATIASEIRRRSHSRDSQSLAHSLEEDHQRAVGSVGSQDHSHNHSNLSGARDHEQLERPASSSAGRAEASSLYHVKESDKSRQQESEDMRGQDGSVIVKAEPGDHGRNTEMMSIPSVSSMLPMAHQSAMLSNAAHAGHAMFTSTTMGHHGMFDTSLTTQDMRRSEVHGQARQAGRGQGEGVGADTKLGRESDVGTRCGAPLPGLSSKSVGSRQPAGRLSGYSMPTASTSQHTDNNAGSVTQNKSVSTQFECHVCCTSFQSRELLNSHMQLMHSKFPESDYCHGAHSALSVNVISSSALPPLMPQQSSFTSLGQQNSTTSTTGYYNQRFPIASDSQEAVTLLPSTACLTPQGSLMSQQRVSQGRMWCKYCRRKFLGVDGASFAQHLIACKQNASFKCGQCGRVFGSRVAYNDHVDSMHSKKGFRCNACGMVFKWRTYVYQHRLKCSMFHLKKEPC